MQAIILTAGYGRRMQPLTYTTHKTLLKINERTVLQWIIDALLECNITDITCVTGYRAEDIRALISQIYPTLNINYVHNPRYDQTNNIYSMALALEQMTIYDDVILIESDLIFEPVVLKRLLACPYPNVALVDHFRSGMDGTVVTVKDSIITEIIPPHLQSVNFNFSNKFKTLNIYRFSKNFCQTTFKKLLSYYAKVIDDNCYYELILGILIYLDREMIHAEILQGEKWAEIDDPNDLEEARFTFEPATRRKILDQSFGGFWHYEVLDFCYLRNMYFPSSAVLSELRAVLPTLMQNYGSSQAILNQKLAYYLLCQAKNVTALNGASQIYPLLQTYLQNKRVLLPKPTFGEYTRIFPQADTYSDSIGLNVDKIELQAKNADVLIIVNPNNPTGSILSTEWIYNFAATHTDKLLIVDESFLDFSNEKSMISLLEQTPLDNVILIKSLSKTLGVPGIRLGYVYTSHTDFNTYLKRAIPVWNLNSIAEYFLEILLKHQQKVKNSFEQTIHDREAFSLELNKLKMVDKVYSSSGNFLLVRLVADVLYGEKLAEIMLLKHNIYIKDVSNRLHSQQLHLRLAVRFPEENQRCIQCLNQTVTEMCDLLVSNH